AAFPRCPFPNIRPRTCEDFFLYRWIFLLDRAAERRSLDQDLDAFGLVLEGHRVGSPLLLCFHESRVGQQRRQLAGTAEFERRGAVAGLVGFGGLEYRAEVGDSGGVLYGRAIVDEAET